MAEQRALQSHRSQQSPGSEVGSNPLPRPTRPCRRAVPCVPSRPGRHTSRAHPEPDRSSSSRCKAFPCTGKSSPPPDSPLPQCCRPLPRRHRRRPQGSSRNAEATSARRSSPPRRAHSGSSRAHLHARQPGRPDSRIGPGERPGRQSGAMPGQTGAGQQPPPP